MLTLAKRSAAQARAAVTLRVAEVAVTDSGVAVRVTDFGVGLDQQTGLQLLTYINMERVCAEGVGHFPPTAVPRAPAPPGSTAPRQGGSFPVRRGYVQPYVGGAATAVPGLIALSTSRCGMRSPLTARRGCSPLPRNKHWLFWVGGAIASKFSTGSSNEDIFTGRGIVRASGARSPTCRRNRR
jgi:hypothetical protein